MTEHLRRAGHRYRMKKDTDGLTKAGLRDEINALIEKLAKAVTRITQLETENRFLFEVIKNDPLLVERYNAFVGKVT